MPFTVDTSQLISCRPSLDIFPTLCHREVGPYFLEIAIFPTSQCYANFIPPTPLICIFIGSCYFTRTWKYTGGLMSVLACISILQGSALFSSLLLVPQSVTSVRKLSLNQRKRLVLSYVSIRLCIILFYNYSFMYFILPTNWELFQALNHVTFSLHI